MSETDTIPTADAPGDGSDDDTKDISDTRRANLEAIRAKNVWFGALLGLLLGPLGYVYLGQWRWAVINFFIFNYLLLGIIIVPLHVLSIHSSAKRELQAAGYST